MLEGTDSARVSELGNKLLDAHKTIDDIGNQLKTHMGKLDWDSEAGEAFRDWGNKVANATLTLADYAKTAGTYITDAGTALSTAKSAMPAVPEGAEAARALRNLSPRGDLVEAAANLFSHLRALDASGAKSIAVMRVPREGLGEAINDRLKRAAAPRP